MFNKATFSWFSWMPAITSSLVCCSGKPNSIPRKPAARANGNLSNTFTPFSQNRKFKLAANRNGILICESKNKRKKIWKCLEICNEHTKISRVSRQLILKYNWTLSRLSSVIVQRHCLFDANTPYLRLAHTQNYSTHSWNCACIVSTSSVVDEINGKHNFYLFLWSFAICLCLSNDCYRFKSVFIGTL